MTLINAPSFNRLWTDHALCADTDQYDPAWFDHDGDKTQRPIQEREAKKVCAQCPVQVECLEEALSRYEWGIWGGTNEDERRIINGKYPKKFGDYDLCACGRRKRTISRTCAPCSHNLQRKNPK